MKSSILVTALIGFLLTGCSPSGDDPGAAKKKSGKPSVHAVNYPLAWFAERLGGDKIDVVFRAPAGEDPAFWEPTDEDVAAFQDADLILLNGADYAKWVDHVSLPDERKVDTSAAFADQYIVQEKVTTHSHGKDGDHAHGGTAFTTWLDMEQAVAQAAAVRDALKGALGEKASAELDANFAALETDLNSLHEGLLEIRATVGNRPVTASHPVYQYLSRRYGLNLEPVLWEPGVHPNADQWKDFEQLLIAHKPTIMLWEGEPHPDTAAALEERGIAIVLFDPCGNRPETGDFLSVLNEDVANLKAALAE